MRDEPRNRNRILVTLFRPGCVLAPRTAIDIVNLWLAGRQASRKVEHTGLLIGMLSLGLLCLCFHL